MKVTVDTTKTHDETHDAIKAIVQQMCLMDDDFMTVVLENKICAELVLRIILNKNDLEVISCKSQYTVSSLKNRAIRLDVFAKDSKGKLYDIEVQNETGKKEAARRIRLYSALIDSNYLHKGEKTKNLPETYIIFITGSDLYKKGMPLYTVERRIRETKGLFTDGLHILLVNSQYRGNTPLGKLMHDFHCVEPKKMHYELLSETADFYKNGEGESKVCKLVKDYCEKEKEGERRLKEEAIKRANRAERKAEEAEKEKYENAVRTARFLLSKAVLTYEDIAEAAGLSIVQVKHIEKSMR